MCPSYGVVIQLDTQDTGRRQKQAKNKNKNKQRKTENRKLKR